MTDSKWFKPSNKPLNWSHTDAPVTRRKNALKARRNNPLKAGRALLSLSNVTRDGPTKKAATIDAHYFFAQNKKAKR
jgi:hypothetical protein